MRRITLFIMMAVFLLLFASCSDGVPASTDKEWLNTVIPEDEIILIYRHINYSDGYTNRGTFVDSAGNVYLFDFSDRKDIREADETGSGFLQELGKVKENGKPCVRLDTESMQHVYYYSSKINKDAEFKGQGEACDMGENQLIICDTDTHELFLCRERGDYTGQLTDSNAENVLLFFDESIKEQLDNCIKNR